MERGFTLLELLMVVAIIAILTAVLIPALLNSRRSAADSASAVLARNIVSLAEIRRSDHSGNIVYPNKTACTTNLIDSLPRGTIFCEFYQDSNISYVLVKSSSGNYYYFDGEKLRGPLLTTPLEW